MPPTLRSRIALLGAAACLFLPVIWSSPRGLTHLLTCQQKTQTPFSIFINQKSQPVLTTSLAELGTGESSLCGGLDVDLRASVKGDSTVTMTVFLRNNTVHPWRGTVDLTVGNLMLPLSLGRIGPRGTGSASEDLHLLPGAHDLEGALLLGP
ncbi:MAG TPA: hypothetical protein VGK51_07675 [Actinomycetota bacterium]